MGPYDLHRNVSLTATAPSRLKYEAIVIQLYIAQGSSDSNNQNFGVRRPKVDGFSVEIDILDTLGKTGFGFGDAWLLVVICLRDGTITAENVTFARAGCVPPRDNGFPECERKQIFRSDVGGGLRTVTLSPTG